MKLKLKSRLQEEITITSDMQMTPPLGQKVKKPLDESEKECKSWLKIQHSKPKIMASGPITSWQKDGEKVETVTDFIFLGSQISAVTVSSVAQSCLTLCDPVECSIPGFPVHHQLPELAQTHVHQVANVI